MIKHNIAPEDVGQRLDKYLHIQHPEHSRAWIQKLITDQRVMVNEKIAKPHLALRAGDTVEFDPIDRPSISLDPEPDIAFRVIAETADYAVIVKPAGLVVHPAEGVTSHTLVNGLLHRWPDIAKVGEDPVRPGIVHRLDKEVSGLMLVTLNQASFEYYKLQFQAHSIKKHYLALVYDPVLPDEGAITFAIVRTKDGRMSSRPNGQEGGRPARTEYDVLERFNHVALVGVRTLTGRTHQIRVHFHGLGHPLVGDPLYRIGRFSRLETTDQLMLLADQLAFTDRDGNAQAFKIDPPEWWQNTIKGLRDS
jgi:23S rRNA pseudouridine1911/1915/1917 synthase